jgi:single-stranded DNA-binding protein
MANDLNRVCLIGRLGKDAELVESKSGKPYMKFSLATNRKKGGEEVTEWHNITVWNEKLGKQIYLEGLLTSWKKDENSIIPFIEVSYGHNIQLLGSKNDEQVEPKQSGQDGSVFGKPAVRGKPDTDTDSGVPW